jgi:hypothetical protein
MPPILAFVFHRGFDRASHPPSSTRCSAGSPPVVTNSCCSYVNRLRDRATDA